MTFEDGSPLGAAAQTEDGGAPRTAVKSSWSPQRAAGGRWADVVLFRRGRPDRSHDMNDVDDVAFLTGRSAGQLECR